MQWFEIRKNNQNTLEFVEIDHKTKIATVLAVGYTVEVAADDLAETFKYYRTLQQVH
jgi:hypothetical protein